MDSFDFPKVPGPKRKNSPALVWNVLTIIVLLSIVCVVAVFFLIYINPNSSLNPFPPPTLIPSMIPATATVTPRITMVPTWTPTKAGTPGTPTQLVNQVPTATSTPASPSPILPAATSGFAFIVQPGSPSAVAGDAFHPEAGCDWTWVGGQVTSLNGEAADGLIVQLGGSMPGTDAVDMTSVTGYSTQYGSGGYEFTLANKLFASEGTLWVQLMDQQKLPLSERVHFNTYDDCQKNLIVISFNQIH